MKLKSPYLIKHDTTVKLSRVKTDTTGHFENSESTESTLEKHRGKLEDLQEVFYAAGTKALLIVLQGMDTAGKDGTIRHIFSGFNPQGCDVAAFKVPTPLEARHDFLWRCQLQAPPRGMIGIFNRSHYEDVLSPRVHGKLTAKDAERHLDDINAWEETLTDNGTVILKFFLHISRDEQTRRLQARIDTPDKHWKLSPADFAERGYWAEYMKAYEAIFERTSTRSAPWLVIPSDHKWYRNVAISEILVDCLEGMKLKYPAPVFDPKGLDLKKQADKEIAEEVATRVTAASGVGAKGKTKKAKA